MKHRISLNKPGGERWTGIDVPAGRTILETALSEGIDYPHGCRSGNCGGCKSHLISGEVEMSPYSPFALTEEERGRDLILACRSVPWSDCTVQPVEADEEAVHASRRLDCRVAGIDLTAEFCDVSRHLTALLGLEERVSFEQGDALAMPYADAAFDGAYSMNVSMNIADKRALYRGIHRVLKPGARLGLSEVVQGPGGEPDYPTPWARTAASSFIETADETRANLVASGFAIESLRDTTEASFAYAARSRAVVEAGGKPLHRALPLIHGALAEEIMANTGRALRERSTVPIEVFCRKVRK